jgi:hypothetical protein
VLPLFSRQPPMRPGGAPKRAKRLEIHGYTIAARGESQACGTAFSSAALNMACPIGERG